MPECDSFMPQHDVRVDRFCEGATPARRVHSFGPFVQKVVRYLLSRGFAAGAVRVAVEAAADEDGYGEELDEFGGSSEFS